jgi:hypothetical protein
MSATAAGSRGGCASGSTIMTSVRDDVSVRRLGLSHEDPSDGLRAVSHYGDDLAVFDVFGERFGVDGTLRSGSRGTSIRRFCFARFRSDGEHTEDARPPPLRAPRPEGMDAR